MTTDTFNYGRVYYLAGYSQEEVEASVDKFPRGVSFWAWVPGSETPFICYYHDKSLAEIIYYDGAKELYPWHVLTAVALPETPFDTSNWLPRMAVLHTEVLASDLLEGQSYCIALKEYNPFRRPRCFVKATYRVIAGTPTFEVDNIAHEVSLRGNRFSLDEVRAYLVMSPTVSRAYGIRLPGREWLEEPLAKALGIATSQSDSLAESPVEVSPVEEPPAEQVTEPETFVSQDRDSFYESLKVLKAWLTPEEFRGYLKGNALMSLYNQDKKGPAVQEVRKAEQYLAELEKTFTL